jgi:hypothetical protein
MKRIVEAVGARGFCQHQLIETRMDSYESPKYIDVERMSNLAYLREARTLLPCNSDQMLVLYVCNVLNIIRIQS